MNDGRYGRQTILEGVGEAGQKKLADSRVVIIGCGGLGSPCAAYLAGAGVGNLRLVDGDRVSVSNLHRQVFYHGGTEQSKVAQLAGHLRELNDTISVKTLASDFNAGNARQIVGGADLVLDCTDDAVTKHLINDACVALAIPLLYAAAQGFSGYVALFPDPGSGINLRDVYPRPDPGLPDCATTGALPTAVGIVAMLQANAALCYLLGIGEPPLDCLLTYSALDNNQHRMRLAKTYSDPIPVPWSKPASDRNALEIVADSLTPPGFGGIYSMLSEEREPDLPKGVIRMDQRNPVGQALAEMEDGGRYLVYCNSGKLSLVLAARVRKERPGVEVFSLRGGVSGAEELRRTL